MRSRISKMAVVQVPFAAAMLAATVFAAPGKRAVVKRADIMACSDAIQTSGAALTVQAPLLRYTITAFNPGWFDPQASRQGPPLFTLRVSPQLLPYADRLTLRVHVSADTTLGSSFAPALQVFDRTSEPLGASRVGVPLTSGEVFGMDFQSGAGTDFRGSDLYSRVAETREVPPMNLRLEFSLFCSGAPVAENGVNVAFGPTARVRTVRTVRALSPGADVAASRAPTVLTLFPVFRIASELYDDKTFEYAPGEARLEVFVHEVDEGQSPQEAFGGLEFARFPADRFPVIYPADQPALVPGRTYVWRARALLRGPQSRYSYSNGLQFRVDPALDNATGEAPPAALSDPPVLPGQARYGETYSRRVLAALKIILGPGYDAVLGARRDQVPAQGLVRLNGRPYSLEELESLARQFASGRQRVTRIRFE